MLPIYNFVKESNKIEGIFREPAYLEMEAHHQFLESNAGIEDLQKFVSIVAPNHVIRDREGLNVRVGNHVAPAGGMDIVSMLNIILTNKSDGSPFKIHCQYETLHPFTDGNGRSGRVFWLWMMKQQGLEKHALELGFLHAFYYQTLSDLEQK